MRRWVLATFMLFQCAAGALEIVIDGVGLEVKPKAAPLPDGAVAQSGPDENNAGQLALSPDGSRAATAGPDGKVRVWDTARSALVATITTTQAADSACNDVCFSADGQSIFSAGADHTVRQFDLSSGKEIRKFEGHEGEVKSVACSDDGMRMASADSTGVRIWELKNGQQLHLLTGHKLPSDSPEGARLMIDCLVFSPGGRILVSEATDESARLWDVLAGKELRYLPFHDGANAAVAISPDGALGVSTRGVLRIGSSPRLRVWETATGKVRRTILGHQGDITCDTFSPDGRYVLSGAEDRTIRQWEVESGIEVRRLKLSCSPVSVAYGPDGKFAVSVSLNEGVVTWDMTAPPELPPGSWPLVSSLGEAWRTLAVVSYEARTRAIKFYLHYADEGLDYADKVVADLRRRLEAAGDASGAAARRKLIEQLDDPSYSVRNKAYADLEELGPEARAELAAAAEHSSAEVRSRVAALLNAIGGPVDFRAILAAEILATLKNPEAKAELERLAGSSLPCAAHAKALLARKK